MGVRKFRGALSPVFIQSEPILLIIQSSLRIPDLGWDCTASR